MCTCTLPDFSFDAGVWKLPMGTRLGGQFEVRLEITFGGQFRVTTEEDDGEGNIVDTVGDWEPLEPIVRSFVAPYPVQQLQAVLTAGQR